MSIYNYTLWIDMALKALKADIIDSSISKDQERVAAQWLNTFKYNESTALEIGMTQLLLACVAKGEFRIATDANKTLRRPGHVLKNIDYLSHASRVIIDYKALSPELIEEFTDFFPEPKIDNVITSRSATHSVHRQQEEIIEDKGFTLGVKGQLPELIRTPYDFGINIAMGGINQLNFVGKRILLNGASGHVYFHHQHNERLLMMGLEQSAPAAGIVAAIWGQADTEDTDVQKGHDQFEQGHSLVGASDIYTAAGSLYFSDPMYQAKLLAEVNELPPKKYGGMQVRLTDENWPLVKAYLLQLRQFVEASQDEELLGLLLSPPSTASHEKQIIHSFIAIDFKTYLKRAELLLSFPESVVQDEQEGNEANFDHVFDPRIIHQEKITTLLTLVEKLQAGQYHVLEKFQRLTALIIQDASLSDNYRNAINRINILVGKQIHIDPNLKSTHTEILHQAKCEDLQKEIIRLSNKLNLLIPLYNADYIAEDDEIRCFKSKLSQYAAFLGESELALRNFHQLPVLPAEIEDLEQEEVVVVVEEFEPLEYFSLQKLDQLQDSLGTIEINLAAPPKLFSESTYNKLQTVLADVEHMSKKNALERNQALTQVKELRIEKARVEKERDDALGLFTRLQADEQNTKSTIAQLKAILSQREKTISGLEASKQADNQVVKTLKEQKNAHQQIAEQLQRQLNTLQTLHDDLSQRSKIIVKNQHTVKENVIQLQSQSRACMNDEVEKDNVTKIEQKLSFEKIYQHFKKIKLASAELPAEQQLLILKMIVKVENEIDIHQSNADGNVSLFHVACSKHIEETMKQFKHNQEISVLLKNLVLCICSLGVAYLAAVAINRALTGNFLFFKSESDPQYFDKTSELVSSISRPK